ncbi:hypothetical protein CDL60_18185 [Roseateles noduli]|nr:hypothetical protein CDL60_18185 [Roseateles noduli]
MASDLSDADHDWIRSADHAKDRSLIDLRQVTDRATMAVVRDASDSVVVFTLRGIYQPIEASTMGALRRQSTPRGLQDLEAGRVFPTSKNTGQVECLSDWKALDADTVQVRVTYFTVAGDFRREMTFVRSGKRWLFDQAAE